MPDLHAAVHRALPRLSFPSRTVIDALLLGGGSIGPSRLVAARLGLTNRFALARQLRKDGLPSLHRLAGWIRVLQWVWQWEHQGVSLNRAASRAAREPAAYYRIVARITGESWTVVRRAGFDRVIARLLSECGRTHAGGDAVGDAGTSRASRDGRTLRGSSARSRITLARG